MSDSSTLPPWAARQAAITLGMLEAATTAVSQGQPADRALRQQLKDQRKYGSRDRRLFGDAIFTWFRWAGIVRDIGLARGLCLAWYLDAHEWPPALLALLEDLDLDVPPPLAPETSIADRLAAASAWMQTELPGPGALLPDWLRTETETWAPLEERLTSHISRPPTWLRVDQEAQASLHDDLVADGAEWAGDISPCSYAFRDAGKVNHWLRTRADVLEIQDLASQQAVRIASPKKGDTWWDACCGAGGKSLQLLDAGERDIDLTCTDRREGVLTEVTRRGRRHGLARVRRYALDLLQNPVMPNIAFDGILLDAPCSGSGTWARNPDGAWRVDEKDVRQFARRQERMLRAVTPPLKPGGVLVYAVCSNTRSETDEVIEAFLAAEPGFALDPVPHPLTGEATDGRIRITAAQSNGDDMYIARLVKKG